jgi:hypothetical protein
LLVLSNFGDEHLPTIDVHRFVLRDNVLQRRLPDVPSRQAMPVETTEVSHRCAKDMMNLIASTKLAGCAPRFPG